jgi:hypothetical protein
MTRDHEVGGTVFVSDRSAVVSVGTLSTGYYCADKCARSHVISCSWLLIQYSNKQGKRNAYDVEGVCIPFWDSVLMVVWAPYTDW